MAKHTLRTIATMGAGLAVAGIAYDAITHGGLNGLIPGAAAAPIGKTTPGGCSTAFKAGQYVGAYGNGYVVVVGGQQIGQYADLTTAQNAYNSAVCPGG